MSRPRTDRSHRQQWVVLRPELASGSHELVAGAERPLHSHPTVRSRERAVALGTKHSVASRPRTRHLARTENLLIADAERPAFQ